MAGQLALHVLVELLAVLPVLEVVQEVHERPGLAVEEVDQRGVVGLGAEGAEVQGGIGLDGELDGVRVTAPRGGLDVDGGAFVDFVDRLMSLK